MFNVDANLFRLTYLAVSTEETRYYLNGVCIEAHPVKGVFLTATDGRRLLCLYDESGSIDGAPVIVRLDNPALAACKPSRRENKSTARRLSGGDVSAPATISRADGEQVAVQSRWNVDVTFPDWRRVLPRVDSTKPQALAAYNAHYLATFGEVAEGLELGGGITVATNDAGGPALIRFLVGRVPYPAAFGVLMPMRLDGDATVFPDFLNARPAAAKAT